MLSAPRADLKPNTLAYETEALVNKLADSLRDVEPALGKFDSDSYGVCEGCGQPIAPARLEARPEARLCINCAASAANRR